jgi:hypothetical protein
MDAVTAFLLALFALSLVLAVVVVLSILPRTRRRFRTRQWRRLLGVTQLGLGGLWVLFGVLYLSRHGTHQAGGWYAVVLGALWCWQAARRLLPGR